MESKHSLIKFIFSTFRRNTVIEEIFWSREDIPITDVLVLNALPFSIVLTKSERFIQSFHFSVFFRLMESKHSLIKFIFSTFRRNTVIEEIFWSREDIPITDVLVDTAKIRT